MTTKQGEEEKDQNGDGNLLSTENLDRTSPEIWLEKYPGISDFINNYSNSNYNKPPYSRSFGVEDNNYLQQLGSMSTAGLITKVKELHDVAYQLGLEESKEMTRGKYLNLFDKKQQKHN